MTLRFEHPEWLWLLALIPPLCWAGWRWMGGMSRVRKLSALVLRAALVTILALMLAGVSSVRQTSRLAVIGVVDVSGSVRTMAPEREIDGVRRSPLEQARAWLKAASEGRGPDDLLGVVAFDGSALVVGTPRGGSPRRDEAASDLTDVLDRPLDIQLREGTDIAGALRLAQSVFPPDAARRIVLLSDGNETSGDALAAARAMARARGDASGSRSTPVDVVPFDYRVDREVIVEAVDVPSRAPARATVTARVRLWSAQAARGLLRLQADERDVALGDNGSAGRVVDLQPGINTVLVNVPLNAGRTHRFTAIFEPITEGGAPPQSVDRLAANNRADGVTITPGAGRVLVLDGFSAGRPGPGSALPDTLKREGVTVDVLPPEQVPQDLLELEKYDLVLMHNASASAVPQRAQELLVTYVTEMGGGLVMVGGPEAFGAGGWKGSPLEPILPVNLDLPEKMIVPSAAVMIVMDTSGSMAARVLGGTRTQQQIANEGAALAIRSLDKNDLVGVTAFDDDSRRVILLQRNEAPEIKAREVLSLSPGGGTNLPPALQDAWEQLKAVDAQVKHVIVLSDGMSNNAQRVPFMADQMAKEGIKVSAIAVGDMADRTGMRAMARAGGGTFYDVTDPNLLPRLFLKAVQVIRTPMIREKPFEPVVQDLTSPLLAGIARAAIPPLGGLVLTSPRGGLPGQPPTPGASSAAPAGLGSAGVTYALVTPQGEPVLAHWQAGLGQVAAFTSDAAVWAEPWLNWPGYGQLWTQIARTIARPSAGRNVELVAETAGDEVRLRLDAFDDEGRPRDGLNVTGAIYTPAGERREVRLVQTGPGTYEGVAPADESGTYIVTLTPTNVTAGVRLPPVIGAATKPVGGEYRQLQSNPALLAQIAEVSGGRVLTLDGATQANLFSREGLLPQEARLPLLPLLLPIAIAVFWLDVGTRRVAWDRLLSREVGATLVADAAASTAGRGAAAARSLSALRQKSKPQPVQDQAGAALEGNDAQAIQRAAKARRAAQRAAPATSADQPKSDPAPDSGASGLAAAKRRAREKMEG